MKQGKISVAVFHDVKAGSWAVFVDYAEPRAHESAFVKRWKTEGEAEMHAEIIRCAMAWEPSRAGRRWRTRDVGRGDKLAK